MAKIDITKTELVWPGKYNEDGTLKEVPRVSLPFQVIETVNESRATREAKKGGVQGGLFDVYEGKEGDTFEAGWRNKLIWGDNLLVMGSLLEKFAGKVDLIYIDPPFATGVDFSFQTEIGDGVSEVTKDQSLIEEKMYRDTWARGRDSYLEMLAHRFSLMRDLLSPAGSIYVHLDWQMGHYVKLLLDDIFGSDRFTSEIVWQRNTAHNNPVRFGPIHDLVFYYTKSPEAYWQKQYVAYDEEYIRTSFTEMTKAGRRYRINEITGSGLRSGDSGKPWRGHDPSKKGRHWAVPTVLQDRLKLSGTTQHMLDALDRHGYIELGKAGDSWPRLRYFLDEMPGVLLQDIWTDVYRESSGIYATQKPEALLDRIVRASSPKGGLVADFFSGSGTTLAVAEKLGRRWIGCDLGRWGIHISRKRLLGIENCKPFEVLNLGKYERQYWQGVTFGDAKEKPLAEQALYEYLAFILKLYSAQPVAGMAHLHGKKGKTMIHIGAVDAPVTIAEIDAAVDECAKLQQGELHVLGWEWEMGLYDLMVEAAKKKGVKLLLLQIPREVMEQQAAAKGDVHFFELAYLEAEIKQAKKLTVQVVLKDFVIPNTELIPEDVRSKVKKWSDYIDYWAVDWDFRNDTFMQGWVAYRTRKERKLPLSSDAHAYEKPGKYRILVKVIDIFGNDTSQAFDVEVK